MVQPGKQKPVQPKPSSSSSSSRVYHNLHQGPNLQPRTTTAPSTTTEEEAEKEIPCLPVAPTDSHHNKSNTRHPAAPPLRSSSPQQPHHRFPSSSLTNGDHHGRKPDRVDEEAVFRRVRGILNKITVDNFPTLIEQLLTVGIANEDVLRGIVILVFNKAVDEPHFAAVYAQLCYRLGNEAPSFEPPLPPSPLQDPPRQVSTFTRLLLAKCKEEFLNRKKFAALNSVVIESSSESIGSLEVDREEERDARLQANAARLLLTASRKKMIGNIKFIGELFKRGLMSERIVHDCITELVSDVQTPLSEDVECLCHLLRTAGKELDHEKAKGYMEVYFARIGVMIESGALPQRFKFMMQDLVDLRAASWLPRRAVDGPRSLDEIREEAWREQLAKGMKEARVFKEQHALRSSPPTPPSFGAGMPSSSPPHSFQSSRHVPFLPKPRRVQPHRGHAEHSDGIYEAVTTEDEPFLHGHGAHRSSHGGYHGRGRHSAGGRDPPVHLKGPHGSVLPLGKPDTPQPQPKPMVAPFSLEPSEDDMILRPKKGLGKKGPPSTAIPGPMTLEQQRSWQSHHDHERLLALHRQQLAFQNKPVVEASEPPLVEHPPLPSPSVNEDFGHNHVKVSHKTDAKKHSKKNLQKLSPEQSGELVTTLFKDPSVCASLSELMASFQALTIPAAHLPAVAGRLVDLSVSLPAQGSDPMGHGLGPLSLLLELVRSGSLTSTSLSKALQGCLQVRAEPTQRQALARLLSHCVSHGALSFKEAADTFIGGKYEDVFLAFLSCARESMGKDVMLQAFRAAHIDMASYLGVGAASRMLGTLSSHGLTFLFPVFELHGALLVFLDKLLVPCSLSGAEGQKPAKALSNWLSENANAETQADPTFVFYVTMALLKHIVLHTSHPSPASPPPSKEAKEQEKAMFVSLAPAMIKYLSRNGPHSQMQIVYALQTFCFELGFPKGLMLRLGTYMYDLDIVEEEAWFAWRHHISDAYPGKGESLVQLNEYLNWMKEAEEEEDDDDEEDSESDIDV